jgi:hypothetical protein
MLFYVDRPTIEYNGVKYVQGRVYGREDALRALAKVPEAIVVPRTGSFRSPKEQEALVQQGTSWTTNSNHRRGLAFDIQNFKEVRDKMIANGFTHPATQEGWNMDFFHFVYGGSEKEVARTNPILNLDKTEAKSLPNKLSIFVNIITMSKKYPQGTNEYIIRTQEVAFTLLVRVPDAAIYIQNKYPDIDKFTEQFVWYCENKTNDETIEHWSKVIQDHKKENPELYITSNSNKYQNLVNFVQVKLDEVKKNIQNFVDTNK